MLRALALTPNHLRRPPPVSPERHAAAHRLATRFPPPRAAGGSAGTLAERGFLLRARHEYGDDVRLERYRRPADDAKELRWERRNPAGEWVPGLPDGVRVVDLPLYRERDALMGAAAGESVVLVESESSVDALTGLYATTWAGGASAPPLAHLAEQLADADVVIVPDHDDAGLACCARLVEALPHARVLLGEPDEDARDLLDRVGRREFERLVARAPRAVEQITEPEEQESA